MGGGHFVPPLDNISNCEKTAKAMDLKFCNIKFTHNTDLS